MSRIATSTYEIWKLLKGLVCIHKPSGVVLSDLVQDVNDKILEELNENNPDYEERLKKIQRIQENNGLIDYSSHPLVLGNAYGDEDIELDIVNDLDDFTSGLSLVTINAPEIREFIRDHVFLRQYLLQMELGKATNNSFSYGRILEKSTYEHLQRRPQILEKTMAMIRSAHQRDAFRQAGVSLQSQEAYELAVRGLVRPIKEHEGYTLIYGLECLHYKLPHITLKVTCINESPVYLAEFTAELGLKLRTNAVLHGLRLIRYGPFSQEGSLLPKHINLENVLQGIQNNQDILDDIVKERSDNLILV